MSALVDTWQINNRINLFLLDSLTDEQLDAKLPKGRSARANLVHIHNVRLMWLKSATPELLGAVTKLEPVASKAEITRGFGESGDAISEMIFQCEAEGKVKGFKPHVQAFWGYITGHEAHHRGQIDIVLRNIGLPLSDKVSFGLWEWGVR
jgi:uncharacterized damage-inducible protein DinB